MTLNREAARALFDNAETKTLKPTPAKIARPLYVEPRPTAKAPASAAMPVEEAPFMTGPSAFERMNSPKTRKGPDWRIVAPIGVAAVCAGAVALFAIPQNNQAVEGKTVASSQIAAPPVADPLPVTPPAGMATADNTPAPAAVALAPAPVVQRAALRPAPVAARRAPARQDAAAPSAEDSASNVSAREPYLPTPTLGAPTAVTLTPTTPAPAPVVQPTPPVTEPEPQL